MEEPHLLAQMTRSERRAAAVHDLKNSIATIILATGVLDRLSTGERERAHHFTSMIRRQAAKVHEVMGELLEIDPREYEAAKDKDRVIQVCG